MIDSEAAQAAFLPLREWLIQRRVELGYSRALTARLIGLRRPDQLRAWEEGDNIPTIMWLASWCQALKADLTITPWETE